MRISDWSSDVCSSDLRRCGQTRSRAARGARDDEQSGELKPDDGSLGRNRRPLDPTALIQEVEWNMASKRTLTVVVGVGAAALAIAGVARSEEHTSEFQSLMRISSAVFCLTKKK